METQAKEPPVKKGLNELSEDELETLIVELEGEYEIIGNQVERIKEKIAVLEDAQKDCGNEISAVKFEQDMRLVGQVLNKGAAIVAKFFHKSGENQERAIEEPSKQGLKALTKDELENLITELENKNDVIGNQIEELKKQATVLEDAQKECGNEISAAKLKANTRVAGQILNNGAAVVSEMLHRKEPDQSEALNQTPLNPPSQEHGKV